MDILLAALIVLIDLCLANLLLYARPFGVVVTANDSNNFCVVARRGLAAYHEVHSIAGTAVDPVAVSCNLEHPT